MKNADSQSGGFRFLTKPLRPIRVQVLTLILLLSVAGLGQTGGNHTLYGDLRVDESKVSGLKPISFEVMLTGRNLSVIGRQTVTKNGRFRFENLANGTYYIVVTMDNSEIENVRVTLLGSIGTDYRQDITLEWRPNLTGKKEEKIGVISPQYPRSEPNISLFNKAEEAIKRKDHGRAIALLRQAVANDPKDFEAWTELGTMHFTEGANDDAEKAYLHALEAQPSFALALLNLGKVRLSQKKYSGAIVVLTQAVATPPPSAEANYFLGEAYLGSGKGSKAVDYMNEALRIDPVGKAEIHLRIAAIYDNVGLKDMAATEYEKFLQNKPDYPEKKKLQKYIAESKKRPNPVVP